MTCHFALVYPALLLFAGPGLAQTPWLSPYGDASCGSTFVPTFHTGGEMPVLGNAGFQVVSENLIGSTAGILFLSALPANLSVYGMTLHVDPLSGFPLLCQAGGTAGVAGAGSSSVPLAIPNDAYLLGCKLYLQGFFVDATLPSMLVHTHGLGLTFPKSVPIEVSVVRDRIKYQAHFTGVTAVQADQLGRAIWTANAVAGFSYVKTEQFTCGGQSHWMVVVLHAQTGMEFCLIPGGSFRMGDINGTGRTREIPVHSVHVAPLLIARTEVTQDQFAQIMGTSPWQGQYYVKIGLGYAASYIDWNDGSTFCVKASLRLPSEAEWEYCCRAGTSSCYCFNENFPPTSLGNYAWYDANTYYSNPPERYAHKVAQKNPNAFGLYDFHGNVFEWVEDPWHNNYQCAPSNGKTWLGISSEGIDRGGSFYDDSGCCRSPERNPNGRSGPDYGYGFRPACSLR